MMRFVLVLAILLAPTFGHAVDGLALLNKLAAAAQTQTYTGVFVYRRGAQEETSRIAHAVIDGQEVERIVVMDGSPREVVRHGQQVKCFLPDEDLLIIEEQSRQKRFPALLSAGLSDLTRHYSIKPGGKIRIAGLESQVIFLEPKDSLRYSHELWMDPVSGLLLKSTLLNERGDVLESFSFTEISIGGPVDPKALKPHYEARTPKIQKVRADDLRSEDLPWSFRDVPLGFRKVNAMKRNITSHSAESLQVIFSDGLAAISVFIEPSPASETQTHPEALGPMHVYRRKSGEFRFIVIGEVPAAAVKRLGDGIERKPR